MAERHLIIDHLKLSYEGLFNADELYNVVSTFFFERGWDWYEKINEAHITTTGKQVRIVFEPWKVISDYYEISVSIKLHLNDVKDIEVKQGDNFLRVNQGEIKMTFDGYVKSDRENNWSEKPFNWFISIILEKYFFKNHYQKAENWIKNDVEDLHQEIKTYLNTFKYTYGK